jgi:hypothetical protein
MLELTERFRQEQISGTFLYNQYSTQPLQRLGQIMSI